MFNIPQDTLRSLNTSPAVAANQVFYKNAYNNIFAQSINNSINQAVGNFSKNFKASLGDLNQASKALSDKNSNIFEQTVAKTQSKNFTVSSSTSATLGTFSAQVTKVAKAQSNTSKGFSSTSNSVLGSNATFSITKDGKSSLFNVDLSSATSNKEALDLVASTVNKRDIGVKAEVLTKDGVSSLQIQSEETGKKQSFSISGTFAETSALDQVKETADDAEATINGEKVTSGSNTLTTSNGKVKIEAKAVMAEAETFTVERDNTAVSKAVSAFAEAYNKFADFAQNENSKPLKLLAKQFEKALTSDRYNLEAVGVTMNSEGRLSVNEDTLNQVTKTDQAQVKRIISEFGSFSNTISRKSSQALSSSVSRFIDTRTTNPKMNQVDLFNYQMNSQKVSLLQNSQVGSILDLSL